jgi:hypothetical protein
MFEARQKNHYSSVALNGATIQDNANFFNIHAMLVPHCMDAKTVVLLFIMIFSGYPQKNRNISKGEIIMLTSLFSRNKKSLDFNKPAFTSLPYEKQLLSIGAIPFSEKEGN